MELLSTGLVIIPAYNEEESIAGVLSQLAKARPDLDVLVVDDGSSDLTADVVRQLGVPLLPLPFNLGVGGAMRAGFKYAHLHGYAYAIQLDADGQHDPVQIHLLEAALSRADVIVGSRFGSSATYVPRGPRRWAMKLLSLSITALCGTEITDTTSGFRAASASAIHIFSKHYPTEYLGDTVESLVLAHRSHLTIAEVPTSMRERSAGRPSASPLRSTIYLLRALLVLLVSISRPTPIA